LTGQTEPDFPAERRASFYRHHLIKLSSEVNPNGSHYGGVSPFWGEITGARQIVPVSHLAGRPDFYFLPSQFFPSRCFRLQSVKLAAF